MFRRFKDKKFIYVLMIIVGLIGTVVFFPFKMESGKTCLFQSYFSEDGGNFPYWASPATISQWMLRRYLIPYALIWWFSIALGVWGIYQIRRKNEPTDPLGRLKNEGATTKRLTFRKFFHF